jgi:hypothetical protein
MWTSLMAFFKGSKFATLASGLTSISPFLQHLEQNYVNDKDAKNAIIDSVVQLLQSHKDV